MISRGEVNPISLLRDSFERFDWKVSRVVRSLSSNPAQIAGLFRCSQRGGVRPESLGRRFFGCAGLPGSESLPSTLSSWPAGSLSRATDQDSVGVLLAVFTF